MLKKIILMQNGKRKNQNVIQKSKRFIQKPMLNNKYEMMVVNHIKLIQYNTMKNL